MRLNFCCKKKIFRLFWLPYSLKWWKKIKGWYTLPFLLKYCNALEWESKFILALNAAKNIDYIEKCFKQKLFMIRCKDNDSLSFIMITNGWRLLLWSLWVLYKDFLLKSCSIFLISNVCTQVKLYIFEVVVSRSLKEKLDEMCS